jgi:hypothetical protein
VLDASDNPISELAVALLPPNLQTLRLSGCRLSGALPQALTTLHRLEQLVVAANHIQQADAVLRCPALQHAGLAFNSICALATPTTVSPAAPALVSLDLAHNNIAELATTLQALQALPQLRILSLKGNPASLLPRYTAAVLSALPMLAYLDSQVRRECAIAYDVSSSWWFHTACCVQNVDALRAAAQDAAAAEQVQAPQVQQQDSTAATAQQQEDAVAILLELKLQVAESAEGVFSTLAARFSEQQQQQQQQQASSGNSLGASNESAVAAGSAALRSSSSSSSSSSGGRAAHSGNRSSAAAAQADVVVPAAAGVLSAPLQPIRYHLELCGPDGGFHVCSCAAEQPVSAATPSTSTAHAPAASWVQSRAQAAAFAAWRL